MLHHWLLLMLNQVHQQTLLPRRPSRFFKISLSQDPLLQKLFCIFFSPLFNSSLFLVKYWIDLAFQMPEKDF